MRTIHVPFEWEQAPDAIQYNLQTSTNLSQFEDGIILNINSIETTAYIDVNNFNWDNNRIS